MIKSQAAKRSLAFCGESPLTMRARCSAFHYFPDPLGIVTTEQFDKLEYVYLILLKISSAETP